MSATRLSRPNKYTDCLEPSLIGSKRKSINSKKFLPMLSSPLNGYIAHCESLVGTAASSGSVNFNTTPFTVFENSASIPLHSKQGSSFLTFYSFPPLFWFFGILNPSKSSSESMQPFRSFAIYSKSSSLIVLFFLSLLPPDSLKSNMLLLELSL